MGATALPIPGTIEGVTVYAKNAAGVLDLVGRNETITLPEIVRMTQTLKFPGGEQDMPTNLLESMETSITKNGLDENMCKFQNAKDIEVRWVQTLTNTDGTQKNIGFKAMMTTVPVTVFPGAGIEPSSNTENDLTKKVLTFTLYRDGKQIINVNKITGECTVLDKKYAPDTSML